MFITAAAVPGQRKRTEDHFFMRSRKLHRDEDMVEDALRSKVRTLIQYIIIIFLHITFKLWLYSMSLLRHFKSHDINNSGVIHCNQFKV